MGFRDYYNTRNNKLISKHNVFNQEGKKNTISPLILLLIEKF
ncbi:hypothetical protein [Mycoplasmopsis cynos]|nr:hypothetical protein [Mycoplasmopsis cynos]UWV92911.1 hypothetical protein NWE57_02565 [Mycoplasmopsis cynos]